MEGEPIYFTNNSTQDEFNEYIQVVKYINMFETKESITWQDRMLTLQTCSQTNINKLVAVNKLVKSLKIKPTKTA